MSSILTETLKSVNKGNGEHVFMNNGKPIKYVQDGWKSAIKRAAIKNCRFHDLRLTFATYTLLNGADLVSIRDILGHSDIRMTARYAHSTEELKRRAVESLTPMLNQAKKAREYLQIIHTARESENNGLVSS